MENHESVATQRSLLPFLGASCYSSRLDFHSCCGGSASAANGGHPLPGENLKKLVELMAHLRGPDGCPWDRAQEYDSVKGLLLEEAYEVVDAVNSRDFDAIEDELGDLLFQVVFYSRLAEEEKRFTIDDVVERVHAKLIRRHPHVFGDVRARTPEEALKSWLAVKAAEGESKAPGPGPCKSILDGIPAVLPSTLEAYELGVRAAEVGFDWKKLEDLLDKIAEELGELRRELPGQSDRQSGNKRRLQEEVGDLLFAAANLARMIGSDAESCLRGANQKFKRRFQSLESEARSKGRELKDCTAEELDSLWEAAKTREAK